MQRVNEILEHVHEPSNPAQEMPVTFTEDEILTATDGDSQDEIETFYEAESYLTTSLEENIYQTKEENKLRHIEETSASGQISTDPFLVKWPSISLAFTSSWWQRLFTGDGQ